MAEVIKVLYAEDEESIRDRVIKILRRRYDNVLVAENGAEGYELFCEHRPDIIVTDINMPVMNGFEMVKKIRELAPNVPVIITTAHNETDFLLRAIELKIHYFVLKPISTDKLVESCEACVANVLLGREVRLKSKLLSEYQNAIDSSTIVSKTDTSGIITFVNEAFCRVSGYTKEEIIGKPHSLVSCSECDKQPYHLLWKTIQEGKEWHGTFINMNKAKHRYYVSSTISPIMNEHDEIVEYIAISHDITELEDYRHKLEERVNEEVDKNRQKDMMLQQQSALAAMGEMVNSIAHQWRQPLNAISLITSNIIIDAELGEDSQTIVESSEKIMKLCESMSETITDFMNFFSPQKRLENVSVRKVFESVYALIESSIFKRNIKWNNTIDESITVNCVKNDLQQSIMNIINNAIQAFKNDEEDTRMIILSAENEGERVIISIEDTAGGIPENVLGKIFEPYFTTKPVGIGTGIGLSITKNIIESGEGSIVATNTDKGAKFTIMLPQKGKQQ